MTNTKTVFDAIVTAAQNGFEFRIYRSYPGGPIIMRAKRGSCRNDKIICQGGSLGHYRSPDHDDTLFVWQIELAVSEIEKHEKETAEKG